MKDFQVIEKDVTRAKLTVTPSRVTIKVPNKELYRKQIAFLARLAQQLPWSKFTVRGTIKKEGRITMQLQNGKSFFNSKFIESEW